MKGLGSGSLDTSFSLLPSFFDLTPCIHSVGSRLSLAILPKLIETILLPSLPLSSSHLDSIPLGRLPSPRRSASSSWANKQTNKQEATAETSTVIRTDTERIEQEKKKKRRQKHTPSEETLLCQLHQHRCTNKQKSKKAGKQSNKESGCNK